MTFGLFSRRRRELEKRVENLELELDRHDRVLVCLGAVLRVGFDERLCDELGDELTSADAGR